MRIEQLDRNRLPTLINELKRDRDEIKNKQYAGGANLLGYINTISDAPYDFSKTETGPTERGIVVGFIPDTQTEPVARLHIEVYLDGTTLWTPQTATSQNFNVLIFELGQYVTTWEVVFVVGSARSYTAKFYVVASDTGTIQVVE